MYLSALAYALVEALRRLALKGAEWAEAQVDTIRLKLFKIGGATQDRRGRDESCCKILKFWWS